MIARITLVLVICLGVALSWDGAGFQPCVDSVCANNDACPFQSTKLMVANATYSQQVNGWNGEYFIGDFIAYDDDADDDGQDDDTIETFPGPVIGISSVVAHYSLGSDDSLQATDSCFDYDQRGWRFVAKSNTTVNLSADQGQDNYPTSVTLTNGFFGRQDEFYESDNDEQLPFHTNWQVQFSTDVCDQWVVDMDTYCTPGDNSDVFSSINPCVFRMNYNLTNGGFDDDGDSNRNDPSQAQVRLEMFNTDFFFYIPKYIADDGTTHDFDPYYPDSLSFGSSQGYFNVPPGNTTFFLTDDFNNYAFTTDTLAAGSFYTLIFYGNETIDFKGAIHSDLVQPDTGNNKIRFINAISGVDDSVSFSINGNQVVNLGPGESSLYMDEPNNSQLTISALWQDGNGRQSGLSQTVGLTSDSVLTFTIGGNSDYDLGNPATWFGTLDAQSSVQLSDFFLEYVTGVVPDSSVTASFAVDGQLQTDSFDAQCKDGDSNLNYYSYFSSYSYDYESGGWDPIFDPSFDDDSAGQEEKPFWRFW